MLDIKQFRLYVIRPTLRYLSLHSEAAEELLIGTAMQESRLTYLRQLNDGPAAGVFQMEPATHTDIWQNFLQYKPDLYAKCKGLRFDAFRGNIHAELASNMAYACAMARVHYYRVPTPLPLKDDIAGLGRYWKQFYNTPLGKGTEQEFVEGYEKHVKSVA